MYDLLTRVSQIESTVPYQPEYPLKYDSTFGPWKPIISREESLMQDFKFLIFTSKWHYRVSLRNRVSFGFHV